MDKHSGEELKCKRFTARSSAIPNIPRIPLIPAEGSPWRVQTFRSTFKRAAVEDMGAEQRKLL